MSKYIIDVGKGYIRHGLEWTLTIPVKINEHEDHWMDTRIPVTPYTEPDLEQVKKEAYEQGYSKGFTNAKVQCNIQTEKDLREVGERHYQKGLSDAWEAARKIYDISQEDRLEIFPKASTFVVADICDRYSASEVIEKIRQYEKEKEQQIQVGDEVVSENDIKAVVIDMDDYLLHVLDENGVVNGWPREDAAKTDRHFTEIAAVLEKMRGGQDG